MDTAWVHGSRMGVVWAHNFFAHVQTMLLLYARHGGVLFGGRPATLPLTQPPVTLHLHPAPLHPPPSPCPSHPQVLDLERSLDVFRSVHYIPHLFMLVMAVVGKVLPKEASSHPHHAKAVANGEGKAAATAGGEGKEGDKKTQ